MIAINFHGIQTVWMTMQLYGVLLKQLGYPVHLNTSEKKGLFFFTSLSSLRLALTRVSIKLSSTCDGASKPHHIFNI